MMELIYAIAAAAAFFLTFALLKLLEYIYEQIKGILHGLSTNIKSLKNPKTDSRIREFKNTESFKDIFLRIKAFESDILTLKSSYIRHSAMEAVLAKYKTLHTELSRAIYKKYRSTIFASFYDTYTDLNTLVDKWNTEYVNTELLNNVQLFDDIDGRKLDIQQRIAVVTDDDNNLILAGAGSGKTLTISAKVKYLVDKKGVNPNDILLVTFTRKAAEEMQQRISERLGISIDVCTFHKLGFEFYKRVVGTCPDVFDDLPSFIDKYFKDKAMQNHDSFINISNFICLYMNIPLDPEKLGSMGQIIERQKDIDLETIKSKIQCYQKSISEKRQSLQGEYLKSVEEVMIANHLFLNGINYEYERLYPFQNGDNLRKRYRPDFYLPDYNLYIEHFGINEKKRVPWLSKIEERKYLDGIKWKRSTHKINGTALIETYSYYAKQGRLLTELDGKLKTCGVKYSDIDYLAVYDRIIQDADNKSYSEFCKLVGTFINLYKSMGYEEINLLSLLKNTNQIKNHFFRIREKIFLHIIKELLFHYEKMLCENGYIDFNDMINNSANYVRDGKIMLNYKYIIIDEYQDTSFSRFKLIKHIKDQSNAIVFAVGDDWQSIYRFAGSDIKLFTHFSQYMGYSKTLKLENTYRNSQELIDIASKFILKNPKQLKKHLLSGKKMLRPLRIIVYKDSICAAIGLALADIVNNQREGADVIILGRNNYDINELRDKKDFHIQVRSDDTILKYNRYPSLSIRFMTVHKSKGLEADSIIVLNLINKVCGFPNKMVDDPLLSLVLTDGEEYEYAEERRLFYVALTRTKNVAYLLTPDGKNSIFIDELIKDHNGLIFTKPDDEESLMNNPKCPLCLTGRLVLRRNEKEKMFIGCSNYPICTKTYDDINIMKDIVMCKKCGGYMVKRSGQYGQFYGCTNYPDCYATMDIGDYHKQSIKVRGGLGC